MIKLSKEYHAKIFEANVNDSAHYACVFHGNSGEMLVAATVMREGKQYKELMVCELKAVFDVTEPESNAVPQTEKD